MLRRGFSHTNLQYKYGVHLIFLLQRSWFWVNVAIAIIRYFRGDDDPDMWTSGCDVTYYLRCRLQNLRK